MRKIKFLVILILILFLALPLYINADENKDVEVIMRLTVEKYPIRWTQHLKLNSLKEIDALLDKPVDMTKKGDILTLTNDSDEEVRVSTCRDYWNYKSKGFNAITRHDKTMESYFILGYNPLGYIKGAKASDISYVADFDLTDDPLKFFPLTLGLILSGDELEEIRRLAKEGMTWKDIEPKMEVEIIDKYQIFVTDGWSETTIKLLAWGDFNHDGIEDILLELNQKVINGTYRRYGHTILMRTEENGVFTELKSVIQDDE